MKYNTKIIISIILLISQFNLDLGAHPLITDCEQPPSNILLIAAYPSSLLIDWAEGNDATSWEVEIVNQGLLPTGTGVITSEKPYRFTDLESLTEYDIYIRSRCDEKNSDWAPVVTLSTLMTYCAGTHYYDSGSDDGTYSNDENFTTIVFPDNAGDAVTAVFNSFNTEANYDFLYVYDGPDSSYPLIAQLDGAIDIDPITSTNMETGALTFVFISDYSVTRDGWDISFICAPPPPCPFNLYELDLISDSPFSLLIQWSDNTDMSTWEIELVPQGDAQTNSISSVDAFYNFENLDANTSYDFYIRSVCEEGTSVWLGPYTFTTEQSYCGGEHFYDSGNENFPYQNNENDTTTIFPDAAGDFVTAIFNSFNTEANYDYLRVYDGPDVSYPLLAELDGLLDVPPFTSSDTETGALTFVFTSDGSVTRSGWDISFACGPLLTCPYSLYGIELIDESANTLTIQWSDNIDINTWEVELLPEGDTPTTPITISNNPYTFENLSPGTIYDFYIRSVCAEGESPWFGPFTFATDVDYCNSTHFYDSGGEEFAYQNNENYTTTIFPDEVGDAVTAIFNAFNTEANYDYLRVYDGPDASYPLLAELDGLILNLDPITSTHEETGALTFVFTSDGSVTRSGWDISFICQALPPCPITVSDIELQYASSSSITVGWTDNIDISTWQISLSTDSAPPSSSSIAFNNTATFEDLELNTAYYFYIRSICGEEAISEWSGPFLFNTLLDYCADNHFYDSGGENGDYQSDEFRRITLFPEEGAQQIMVTFLSFDLEANFDRLNIYNGPNDSYPLIISATGQTIPGPFTSSDPSGALTFVFDSNGSIEGSGWDAIVDCLITDTENILGHQKVVQYYPNPTSESIIIQSQININQIRIFNFTGKLIDTQSNLDVKLLEVNLSGYPSGIYYFKAGTNTKDSYIFKVIKVD